MLKIRDDIDLKELEKYGWIYDEDDGFLGNDKVPHYIKYFDYYNDIKIYPEDRILFATHDETMLISEEKVLKYGWIDDLIKDGLVEKVED